MLSEVRTAAARTHAPSGPRPSKHAEALQWSRFAEASLERLGGQPSLDAERLLHLGMLKLDDVADVLAQKGNALVALHRDEEALSVLRRALAIREKLLGPDHPAVASTVRSIGFALMNQGKALEAIPVLKQSLAITEKALGPDHPTVGTALNGLAAALESAGKPDEALPLLKRSLAIEEKALGPDHPLVGNALHNLGQCYGQMEDPSHELEYMLRAIAIWEKAVGPDHPDVAMALAGAGDAYVELHQPEQAIPLLERALRITDAKDADPRVKSEVRYFLAESLWNSGKDRKRAIEIMKVARKLSEDGGEGAKGGSRSGSQPTTREHALRPHSVQSTSDW